jgi:hypothetical protein
MDSLKSYRWGYHNVSDDIENVAQMRAAGIPLEGLPHFGHSLLVILTSR